jgi:hypothetical protein
VNKPVKIRKKRKPMSEEQRAAAGERLKLAREKRMAKNPPTYKNIHPDVLAVPEDQPMSLKSVRNWIKTQKDLISAERKAMKLDTNNKTGAYSRFHNCQAYIRNLERYLRDGVYADDFYGEYGKSLIKWRCAVPAYDKDGEIKRTHGVFYEDIGTVWSDYD